jgi:site-specific recombinase XerD
MNEAIERFGSYLRRRYAGRSTPKHYLSDLSLFARLVGGKQPDQVSVQDVDRFVDQQVSQGLRPATINRRLAALRTFFEFLSAEEPDREWPNPVIWRRHGIKQGTHLPRDASDRDVERLFAAMNDGRDRAIFGLMVGAGLRVGEVAAARLQDLEAPSGPDQMASLRVRGKGDKERMVWLIPQLYATVQAWLQERPPSEFDHLFLNQHRRPLSVAGIQYRLQQHCEAAGVKLTCHQLRHTFARRLAEQEMAVESLSKLMGHAQVQTTQVYIAGADPNLRAAFARAMAQLENAPERPPTITMPEPKPRPRPEKADPAELADSLTIFDHLPTWLQELLHVYLPWRWRNWQPHLARQHARRLAHHLRRAWAWLLSNRELSSWSDLQRSDLEAWLSARQEEGISASTRTKELCEMQTFLRFVVEQDIPLNANLFRVAYPERPEPLPRYLSENEYCRLEQVVVEQTADDTLVAARDRAWFFTLAHTGVRVSELVNLRLGDLDGGRLIVRGGKNARDRVVYLTPILTKALQRYLSHRGAAEDDHLWLDDGRPLKDYRVRYRLKCWGKLCGVSASPHRLRHTLATRLINRGMSLESLRKLLGHKHLRTTQQYARVYDATVREQFETAMAKIVGIGVGDWPRLAFAFTADQSVDTLFS